MAFLTENERQAAAAVAGLSDQNPFLAQRVDLERSALGRAFTATGDFWRVEASLDGINPNLPPLTAAVEQLAPELRRRIAAGERPEGNDLVLYEGVVRYLLYARYEDQLFDLVRAAERGESATGTVAAFDDFARDVAHFLELPDLRFPFPVGAEDIFAWGFQIRRAFHHTFRRIYGGSMPAAELRSAVWQSIFTHDAQRYRRSLIERMGDIPTLIAGESGTGKELVARAIGLSRHIAFDPKRKVFREDYTELFRPLNIAALSPTLVESELFGHRRGSFTGAVADREGWLELCGAHATVFLDEIGELSGEIQIKLLRVLESRVFQRIGETEPRRFDGKIVAATNRDLAAEMQSGRFRADLYYRLCADLISTPTLRDQLRDAPEDLSNMVLMIARRVVGESEADSVTSETVDWIERELGRDYGWPGNVRELEQCVRNFVIRRDYRPAGGATAGPSELLAADMARGELTADELLSRYCTLVYARSGSYEAAARQLGLDRRTVKAKIDRDWLATLRGAT